MGYRQPPWSILEWRREKRKPWSRPSLAWFSTDNFSEVFRLYQRALVLRRKSYGQMMSFLNAFEVAKILDCCAVYGTSPDVGVRVAASKMTLNQRGGEFLDCCSSCYNETYFPSCRRQALLLFLTTHHDGTSAEERGGYYQFGSADSL